MCQTSESELSLGPYKNWVDKPECGLHRIRTDIDSRRWELVHVPGLADRYIAPGQAVNDKQSN